METVAIVGVGLIGGSFGLALQKAGYSGRILGVSSDDTIRAACERGAIHQRATLEEAAASADLIYLAQPISGILSTLDRLGSMPTRSGALITDAGSTKIEIVRRAATALTGCGFLGGHPMAGKETRGVEAADADLFRDRAYLLTPLRPADLEAPAAQTLIAWIRKIGSTVFTLAPEEHDRTVAYTSHLPQMASTALASILAALPEDRLPMAGPGALDMTRLALSAYDIWKDILDTNQEAVDHALAVYIDKLTEIRHNLQTQRLGDEFQVAADAAIRLRR
jgi:prephenate dehydrogenase